MAHTDHASSIGTNGKRWDADPRPDVTAGIRLVPVTTMRNIKIMLLLLLGIDVMNLIFSFQTMTNINELQRLLQL